MSEQKWWQKEYDPIGGLIKKIGKKKEEKKPAIPKEVMETSTPEGAPDFKELEKKGMLGKFFRHWKNPAFLEQMKQVAARMQADGVNMKDQKAIKKWVDDHKAEIESGKFAGGGAAKVETFVKKEPEVGRNEPCPCGSGKKYKKCCAKK